MSKNWAKPFFTIWSGQLVSLIGSGLVQFALVWWMTQTTHSAVVLTTATLVALLPEVILGPFSGALVDRFNRKHVMIIADGAIALATLLLAVLFWGGWVQLWHVYGLLFLRSLGGTFHWPAMQASTSLMVPEKHLSRIAGINQAIRGAINIFVPPAAALLMTVLPIFSFLFIDIGSAALAIFLLTLVAIPQPDKARSAESISISTVWTDVREGFLYVYRWKGVFMIITMAAVINFLFAPGMTLMPLLVTDHFQGGALQLSYLEAVSGIGVIIGGLLLGVWGGFRSRVVTSLTGLIFMGVGVAIVGIAPASAFWVALLGMGFMGLMNPITNGPLQAILQARVAPEMQGRVFMLVGSVCAAMMPLSMLVAGPVSNWLGIQAWYLASGAGCAIMGLLAFTSKDVMRLEERPVLTAAIPEQTPLVIAE